jgi:hypothetical protein
MRKHQPPFLSSDRHFCVILSPYARSFFVSSRTMHTLPHDRALFFGHQFFTGHVFWRLLGISFLPIP